MGQLDILKAVVAEIEAIQPAYIGLAPQGTALPYIVIHVLTGRPSYYFGGSVDSHRIQIDQFYRWEGNHDDAYADNEFIRATLDGEALGGVMMRRISLPSARVEDGTTLHMWQEWEWQEVTVL